MRRISINGYETPVVDRGPRDGLPVVLVHGFPFRHEMWEGEVAALSDAFRTVAYDLRGLGEASVADGQYTLELYVDDLVALLDTLEVGPAVVCGLSMGGYIALRLAEREPEKLRGLVLCDTRSRADDDQGKLSRARTIQEIKEKGLAPFADGFPELVLAEGTLRDRPELADRVRAMITSASPLGVCGAQLAMAARTDTTGALEGIRVPVLFLVGAEDALTPPETARFMANRVRDAVVEVIPGAAHLSNLENPGAFGAALRGFLGGLGSGGSR